MKLQNPLFLFLLLIMFSYTINGHSQQVQFYVIEEEDIPAKTEFNGYISDTQSVISIDSMNGNWLVDNTLHNRLNLKITKGEMGDNWAFSAEVRNRLIYGDSRKYIPGNKKSLSNDNGLFDLSWNLMSGTSFVLNTSIERLSITRNVGKWEFTAGRQRINWGLTFAWNPNDLFNNASLFEFDYDEKPGCDAIRALYYVGPTSSIDAVFEVGSNGRPTIAGMYKTSFENFDLQAIVGYYQGEYGTMGLGFTGPLGKGSIYGETTAMHSLRSRYKTRDYLKNIHMISLGYSYMFPFQLDLRGEFFYTKKPDNSYITSYFTAPTSLKELSPSRYNLMLSATYPITPLLKASFSTIYYTDLSAIYLNPSIDYSVYKNFNLTFFYQFVNPESSAINKKNEVYKVRTLYSIAYLRLKWNF